MLGGFVAFLRRPDAEKAAKELDGAEWGGSMLKTSWGKAVPVPARAIYGERCFCIRRVNLCANLRFFSRDRRREQSKRQSAR